MNFLDFIQLLLRNKKWILGFPIMVAVGVFFLTKDMPQTFSSEMVIYTGIASGYNVDNDISGKIDYHEANSKFDNLINTITSKETRKEVALKLLANQLNHPQELKRLVLKLKLEKFNWLLNPQTVAKLKGINEELTYQNLVQEISKGNENNVYQLIYGKNENPFNLTTLNKIKASRLGFSDMVKVNYTFEDAFVTKFTLDILAEVFLNKYKRMRIGEVNNVVKYFQEETALALSRLQNAEMFLKNFRTTNRVINYYEQTKYIADQKEDFDQRESQLEMDLEGSQSALLKIETKLNSRVLAKIKSEQVVKFRNDLAERYNSKGLSLVKGEKSNDLSEEETESLKKRLKEDIEDLYQLNNSTEGIPGKDLLDQWLNLTVNKEEAYARLVVLKRNKVEFEKIFDKFAPMGSDLNKLERDVDVAEKEYLNLLHNLNQAKLRERNLVVTENISITDPPDMPAVANSSKRFVLVLASLMSCLILVIVILILKEYFDDSISNPFLFQKSTGIKTATAFGVINRKQKHVLKAIDTLSNDRLMQSLVDFSYQLKDKSLTILAVPFHKSQRNYEEIIQTLVNEMELTGNNWQLARIQEETSIDKNTIILAQTSNRPSYSKRPKNDFDLIYLFVNASQKLDRYQLDQLKGWQDLNIPIQCIMVDTKIQYLEKFLGDIPKNRSRLRRRIKDILKRYS